MPWHILIKDSQYCVVKDSDDGIVECHPTREEAEAHMKALYTAMEGEEYTDKQEWRLFIEHQVQPEQWIPYLPIPGTLKHKQYGKVSFTLEKAKRLVENFKKGIYQRRLPIDAEHQTKLSGAVGWITDMRVNDDGSVDALAEWTDRGKKLLANKRFGYISPEFFPNWMDPFSEEMHQDVAVGAAITTRPFIKESRLRPLLANEQGLDFVTIEIEETGVEEMPEVKEVEKEVEDVGQAEEYVEVKDFDDLRERFAEAEASRAEAEAKSVKLTEALDASNARIARMEEEAQTRRFSDMITGGENTWYGNTTTHLNVLRSFAEAFGEDSNEFAEYVQQQQALAEQVATSELFAEYGSAQESSTKTAADELDELARQIQKQNGELTYQQAYSEALDQRPDLYTQHVKGE